MAVESAISSTGAMLGLRLPEPFSVGSASLAVSSGGSGFWRSMATVPERDEQLSCEQRRREEAKERKVTQCVNSAKTSYHVFTHRACVD